MRKKTILSAVIVGAVALATALGAVGYQAVKAQSPTATPSMPTLPDAPAGNPAQTAPFKGERGPGIGVSDVDLAKALGVTAEQLQVAYLAADAAAIKDAVGNGLITQTQADSLAARAAQEPNRHFGGIMARDFANQKGIDYTTYLAQALNISVEKLQSARQQAQAAKIDAALASGTLTQDQADLMKAREALANSTNFQDNLKSAYQTALQQAVTDGIITQAQADLLMKEQTHPGFEKFGMPGMHSMFGGMEGGHHGKRGGFPGGAPVDQNGQNTTPAVVPTTAPASGL